MNAEVMVAQKLARGFIPFSTQILRDFRPEPGDEEEYARLTKPYRGGILSPKRLRDRRISRDRLIQDSEALRHALRGAAEDLVDLKAENARLRAK